MSEFTRNMETNQIVSVGYRFRYYGKMRPALAEFKSCWTILVKPWDLPGEATMTAMAGRLGLSTAAVSKAVVRGAEIALQNGYRISVFGTPMRRCSGVFGFMWRLVAVTRPLMGARR